MASPNSLAEPHSAGRLRGELTRLGRYPLLVADEGGYIPFEPDGMERSIADRPDDVPGVVGSLAERWKRRG